MILAVMVYHKRKKKSTDMINDSQKGLLLFEAPPLVYEEYRKLNGGEEVWRQR